MSAQVDLQGIPAGYFMDRRDALGVVTGQYTLVEYQTAGFSPRCEGFLLEQCLWIAESRSFMDFAPRVSCSRAFVSRQLPDAFEEKIRFTGANSKDPSQYKQWIQKFLFIADDQTSLVQSSRKACSVQIGDE
jgi:hypothetical protein